MANDSTPEKVVQEIRRKTRRRFSAEEKIRIVLEGLRGRVPLVGGEPEPPHGLRLILRDARTKGIPALGSGAITNVLT